jgi:signal transduction histidine kinase
VGSLLHVPGMGKRSAELAAQMLQGEDPARPSKQASLGLASMRERVRMLRGEFEIDSTPSRGTTVVAWVPATSDQ